jgi:hypothetical protein
MPATVASHHGVDNLLQLFSISLERRGPGLTPRRWLDAGGAPRPEKLVVGGSDQLFPPGPSVTFVLSAAVRTSCRAPASGRHRARFVSRPGDQALPRGRRHRAGSAPACSRSVHSQPPVVIKTPTNARLPAIASVTTLTRAGPGDSCQDARVAVFVDS